MGWSTLFIEDKSISKTTWGGRKIFGNNIVVIASSSIVEMNFAEHETGAKKSDFSTNPLFFYLLIVVTGHRK